MFNVFRNWSRESIKKWKFLIFWGPFTPPVAIEVKFFTAEWTNVPVSPAKFDVNRCNESPLRGEKPEFWPVSKFNTDSLPLRGILLVIICAFDCYHCQFCHLQQNPHLDQHLGTSLPRLSWNTGCLNQGWISAGRNPVSAMPKV